MIMEGGINEIGTKVVGAMAEMKAGDAPKGGIAANKDEAGVTRTEQCEAGRKRPSRG